MKRFAPITLILAFVITAGLMVVTPAAATPTIGYCSVTGYVNPYTLQSYRLTMVKGNQNPRSRAPREYEEVVLYYFALEQWNEEEGGGWWKNVAWIVEARADHLHTVREAMKEHRTVTASGKCSKDGDIYTVFDPTNIRP